MYIKKANQPKKNPPLPFLAASAHARLNHSKILGATIRNTNAAQKLDGFFGNESGGNQIANQSNGSAFNLGIQVNIQSNVL